MRITIVYWILAAIFLLVALAVPKLRALGIAGCIILGLMLGWAVVQRWLNPEPTQRRGDPSAPTSAIRTFPLESLDATALRITGNGAPFELRGQIANRSSDLRLRSFTAEIERRDCHAGALDPSGCEVLWRSRQWVDLALAPGETREFASSFWTRGDVPRVRGTVRDEIRIVAADGQSAQ